MRQNLNSGLSDSSPSVHIPGPEPQGHRLSGGYLQKMSCNHDGAGESLGELHSSDLEAEGGLSSSFQGLLVVSKLVLGVGLGAGAEGESNPTGGGSWIRRVRICLLWAQEMEGPLGSIIVHHPVIFWWSL